MAPPHRAPSKPLRRVAPIALIFCGVLTATALAAPAMIRLGSGDDKFVGTADQDSALGGRGNDTLLGRGGRDFLTGQRQADRVIGGSGHDAVFGGPGADVVHGNGGNDVVVGHQGDDSLEGGRGTDTVEGRGGDDRLWSGTREQPDDPAYALTGGKGFDVCHVGTESRDRVYKCEKIVLAGGPRSK